MTRNVRYLLAAVVVVAAVGIFGYSVGGSVAEHADWHTGTARVTGDPEDPEITAHADGWDYGAANKSIQFYGPACEAVKMASGQNVQIIFGCPGVVIP